MLGKRIPVLLGDDTTIGTAPASLNEMYDDLACAGTKRLGYLLENLEALDITLTAAELEELNNAIPQEKVSSLASMHLMYIMLGKSHERINLLSCSRCT